MLASPIQHSENKLYVCIYPLPVEPPSQPHVYPHPIPLCHHRAPSQISCAIQSQTFIFINSVFHPEVDSKPQLYQVYTHPQHGASQVVIVIKNPLANAGDIRDVRLIFGLGIFPWKFHGQRSLVGYIVHGVTTSWTRLSVWMYTHIHTQMHINTHMRTHTTCVPDASIPFERT